MSGPIPKKKRKEYRAGKKETSKIVYTLNKESRLGSKKTKTASFGNLISPSPLPPFYNGTGFCLRRMFQGFALMTMSWNYFPFTERSKSKKEKIDFFFLSSDWHFFFSGSSSPQVPIAEQRIERQERSRRWFLHCEILDQVPGPGAGEDSEEKAGRFEFLWVRDPRSLRARMRIGGGHSPEI